MMTINRDNNDKVEEDETRIRRMVMKIIKVIRRKRKSMTLVVVKTGGKWLPGKTRCVVCLLYSTFAQDFQMNQSRSGFLGNRIAHLLHQKILLLLPLPDLCRYPFFAHISLRTDHSDGAKWHQRSE